ncbi:MAG: hypothetical protein Harvfovirus1_4 [Harvfovirus sp.]|uniref:SAP domain-containing protein n=1 Tax=Harvfovirus sp. TaxID=2487768 RepID=A0A3G5A4I5_9VIRU|nr:MAG: hypothetical protein Harvfovirus1_4 [Harvfovirus sp.]
MCFDLFGKDAEYISILEQRVKDLSDQVRRFQNQMISENKDLLSLNKMIATMGEQIDVKDRRIGDLEKQLLEHHCVKKVEPIGEVINVVVLDNWLDKTVNKLGFESADYKELIERATETDLKSLCKKNNINVSKMNNGDIVEKIIDSEQHTVHSIVKELSLKRAMGIRTGLLEEKKEAKSIVTEYDSYSLLRSMKKPQLITEIIKIKTIEELFLYKLKRHTVKELKDMCIPLHIKKTGLKAELVEKLAIAKALQLIKEVPH